MRKKHNLKYRKLNLSNLPKVISRMHVNAKNYEKNRRHLSIQVYVAQNASQICIFHIFCQMHIKWSVNILEHRFSLYFFFLGFLELDMVDLIFFLIEHYVAKILMYHRIPVQR